MEIILLRHGKPRVRLNGLIDLNDFNKLASEYRNSDIEDNPPKKLIERFNSYYIVTSDLNRSQRSAEKLCNKDINYSDKVFNETDIPYYEKSFLKLPVILWLVLFRVAWLFGFSKNGESFANAKIRAKEATEKLITLVEENQKVILVGHGLMNRLIAKQLRQNNWQGPVSPGKKYWEYGTYKNLK